VRRPNFRGERIPSLAGLAFVLAGVWAYAFEWRTDTFDPKPAAACLLVVLCFGALGLLDDLGGDRSGGGFRGHFRALAKGRLTTGAAKALGGGLISLFAGYLLAAPSLWQIVLAAALIALSANTLNLLDLRPGRCLFGFILGAAAVILTLYVHHTLSLGFLLYVAVAAALILYPMDAGGRLMLGDTGSNSFGAILGVAGVLYFSPLWQAVIVVLLVAFQVWCERNSLSQTIEKNPILRSLDRKIGVR
jgi:UDP-GlcNAc:undecaprenyl-phosphate GlcNAc-1-phosphate transferase